MSWGLTPTSKIPATRGNEMRIQHIFLAVFQGFALGRLHVAASGQEDGVGGGGVPFAGGPHAGIDVGMAFRYAAELQGAARLYGFVVAKAINKGAGFLVQVVFTS